MRIHIIQHVSFEPAGNILDWAEKNEYAVSHSLMFEKNIAWPHAGDFDLLIILGGPMGVYEEDLYSWLRPEKEFIREAIGNDKAILGICLGSQLLAECLGARVYKAKENEIGFFPVAKTSAAAADELFASLPKTWNVFHWHGDTFDLPAGAMHVYESAGCKQQAYRKGNQVGIQFHPELDLALLNSMIENERHELVPGKFVQTENEIILNKALVQNREPFYQFLDKMILLNKQHKEKAKIL